MRNSTQFRLAETRPRCRRARADERCIREGWKPTSGYANGIVASGPMVFVGGQIGWNAAQVFESDDFVAQTRQALENIVAVLAEAGGRPEHLVRLTWYVTDKREYCCAAEGGRRSLSKRHRPELSPR